MRPMWQSLDASASGLGESPFWHPQERSLYWVDIPGRAVLRTRGEIGPQVQVERWPLPSEPGCIAPARRGGLVLALRDGIYRAREWGGELQLLARAAHDVRTVRFNDGKCDPQGRFWAGSINEAKDAASAALYCLDARPGAATATAIAIATATVPATATATVAATATAPPGLVRMLGGVTTANGLAFAPDAARLYWADTPTHTVRVWDWRAADNQLGAAPRDFAHFAPKPPEWQPGQPYGGRPDGATLDALGRYWCALYEGSQLACLAPDGRQVEVLPVPAQCPTMPCFGGDDLRTLFVTTAARGRPADELGRLPLSGRVLFTRADVPGRPVDFFED